MKIFNWIQSKINGKQSTYKSNPVAVTHHMLHQPCKEEFSDWPNELLAIGTFGNLKDSSNLIQPTCRPDHQPDQSLTPEEVGQLHKELKHLFPEESTPLSANGSKRDLEKFFDCLQNLVDDDQQVLENKESNFKRSNSLVRGRGQASAQLENTNSGISKKSLSYLLKKTFFCSSGFTPSPPHPLRDPVLPQLSKFDKSRMEKILRAILQKKIYPQATSPRGTTTRKRYLDNRGVIESESEDEASETVKNNGSKWDKSDSDFIVLEI